MGATNTLEAIEIRNAIIVACHAPFKETTAEASLDPGRDEHWVLQSFQAGEPPLYIAHAERGVELLKQDAHALLIFSGGFTRREAGLRWSEAETYRAIARKSNWWIEGNGHIDPADLERRTALEDFSRDSFENLLFSLCRFHQVVGRYPERATLVSWAFKRERFDLHRAAIGFPAARFCFDGFNNPIGFEAALRGEAATMEAFRRNRYGSEGRLAQKRNERNPFQREHDFRSCPGMREFFAFIENPANHSAAFNKQLPWA